MEGTPSTAVAGFDEKGAWRGRARQLNESAVCGAGADVTARLLGHVALNRVLPAAIPGATKQDLRPFLQQPEGCRLTDRAVKSIGTNSTQKLQAVISPSVIHVMHFMLPLEPSAVQERPCLHHQGQQLRPAKSAWLLAQVEMWGRAATLLPYLMRTIILNTWWPAGGLRGEQTQDFGPLKSNGYIAIAR